jgi:hypothetical protein
MQDPIIYYLIWLKILSPALMLPNNSVGWDCCDVVVVQINYPSFKHNTQDSIEQVRGRSHEEVQVKFLC